jgi:hypothetical protein
MEKFDATFLAGIQKSNDLDIHERHLLEVQRDGRLLAIDQPCPYPLLYILLGKISH